MTTDTLRARVRRASPIDKSMLALLLLVLLIGVGRLVHVATVYPDAIAEARAETAAPSTASVHDAKTLADFLDANPVFEAWWGRRVIPRMQGHDYLLVVTQRDSRRTLGPVLGTIIEQENAEGLGITEVIVPEDNDALVGGEAATFFTTAEGEQISAGWASVAKAARRFTEVPLEEADYDPELTDEHVAELESSIGLTARAQDFTLGGASENGSGTWVLYAHVVGDDDKDREFILIPIEADPKAVAR